MISRGGLVNGIWISRVHMAKVKLSKILWRNFSVSPSERFRIETCKLTGKLQMDIPSSSWMFGATIYKNSERNWPLDSPVYPQDALGSGNGVSLVEIEESRMFLYGTYRVCFMGFMK